MAIVTVGLTLSVLGEGGPGCAAQLLNRLARCALVYGAGGPGVNKRGTSVFSCPLRMAADVRIPCTPGRMGGRRWLWLL